jgi:Trypsin-like peptidase domain
MKKFIIYLIIYVLKCNPCFSQTENNDTLSNKIEEIKKIFHKIGLTNLDKIEGIYFFERTDETKGWESPTLLYLNGTSKHYVHGLIIRNPEIKNRFDIYEYLKSDGYFAEDINKWYIKKEGDKYFMRCCFDSSGKNWYHNETEVTLLENNIFYKEDSKMKTSSVQDSYSFKSIKKIYPSSLEDNIFKTGTGFFISKEGFVVTNYHVIKDASTIYVSNESYKRLKAKVEFTDEFNDIAILKIEYSLKNIPYNIVAANKEIGNNVFTLGYPYIKSMGKEVKLTNGIINSNSGFENDSRYYQFSAEIQPGNSGGPLFDSEGNIVGLVSAKHNKATNAGYALKSKFIIDFIKLNNPSLLKKSISPFKNLSLTAKYKILKDYVLLLEIE